MRSSRAAGQYLRHGGQAGIRNADAGPEKSDHNIELGGIGYRGLEARMCSEAVVFPQIGVEIGLALVVFVDEVDDAAYSLALFGQITRRGNKYSHAPPCQPIDGCGVPNTRCAFIGPY